VTKRGPRGVDCPCQEVAAGLAVDNDRQLAARVDCRLAGDRSGVLGALARAWSHRLSGDPPRRPCQDNPSGSYRHERDKVRHPEEMMRDRCPGGRCERPNYGNDAPADPVLRVHGGMVTAARFTRNVTNVLQHDVHGLQVFTAGEQAGSRRRTPSVAAFEPTRLNCVPPLN
jgi:hypothetical protein